MIRNKAVDEQLQQSAAHTIHIAITRAVRHGCEATFEQEIIVSLYMKNQ